MHIYSDVRPTLFKYGLLLRFTVLEHQNTQFFDENCLPKIIVTGWANLTIHYSHLIIQLKKTVIYLQYNNVLLIPYV